MHHVKGVLALCGRFSLGLSAEQVRLLFAFESAPDLQWTPRYNVAPTQPVLTIVQNRDGVRRGGLMRWGLVPAWARAGRVLINARAETLAERPAFRGAVAAGRRAVVLADGFYEWRQEAPGRRQPYWVTARGQSLFPMAAVFDPRPGGPEGRALYSVAIVTRAASPQMAALHSRMPLWLDRESVDLWLDRAGEGWRRVLAEAGTLDPPLAMWPVGTAVNNPRIDRPDLVVPAEGRRAD